MTDRIISIACFVYAVIATYYAGRFFSDRSSVKLALVNAAWWVRFAHQELDRADALKRMALGMPQVPDHERRVPS